VGALAGGAFALLIRQQLKVGDEIAKTADKLGISTERLEAFKIAAQLAGTDLRALDKGMLRMAVNMADAARGIGEAKDTIAEMGLNAKTVAALPIGEMFLEVSDAIAKLDTATQRATAAYEIFGGRGVALVNIMQQGRKGIEDVEKEMSKLGVLFTRLDLRKIELLNDAWTTMKTVIGAIGRAFAVVISGPAEALVQRTLDWVSAMGGAQQIVKTIIGFLKAGAFTIAETVDSILRVIQTGILQFRVTALKVIQELILSASNFAIAFVALKGGGGEEITAAVKPFIDAFRSITPVLHEAQVALRTFEREGARTFSPMESALERIFGFLSDVNEGLGETAKNSLDAVQAFRKGLTTDIPELPAPPDIAGAASGRLEAIFQGSQQALRAGMGRTPTVNLLTRIEKVMGKIKTQQQKQHVESTHVSEQILAKLGLTPIRL
jgi:hypothetical protein